MEDKLKEIYYNPTTGLISAAKLYHKVKNQGITLKQVKDFIKSQEIGQLYKPVTKEKVYFPISSHKPYEHLQIDLLDLSNISSTNSNFKYLLVSLDIFTRMAFVVPIKFKNAPSVAEGMEKIIKFFKPEIITSDNGKEFLNSELKDIYKRNHVEHRLVDVNQHASLGVVDRFCRTLRGLINKYCTSHKTTKYIDVLDDLIKNYNSTYHSTIKCAPKDADKHIEEINNIMIKKYSKAKQNETIFNIGDKVRHMINLSIFEKQGQSKWSQDTFTVVDKKTHSYKLTNGKWYRYYQLLPVESVTKLDVEKPSKQTMQSIRKENTAKRRFKQSGLDVADVVTSKRKPALKPWAKDHLKP